MLQVTKGPLMSKETKGKRKIGTSNKIVELFYERNEDGRTVGKHSLHRPQSDKQCENKEVAAIKQPNAKNIC